MLAVVLFEHVGPNLYPAVYDAPLEAAVLGDGNHWRNLAVLPRDAEQMVQYVVDVEQRVGKSKAHSGLESLCPGQCYILTKCDGVAYGAGDLEIDVA